MFKAVIPKDEGKRARSAGSGLIETMAAACLLGFAVLSALLFQSQSVHQLNENSVIFGDYGKLLSWRAEDLTSGRCAVSDAGAGKMLVTCRKQAPALNRESSSSFMVAK